MAPVNVELGAVFVASASEPAVPDERGIIANGLGENTSEREPNRSISGFFNVLAAAGAVQQRR